MAVHEECGVFGVMGTKKGNVAGIVYYGLYALQHRGQESCGIVVNDDGVFSSYKDLGLVSEVFSKDTFTHFPMGNMAVGHVRYGTTGGNTRNNCQPVEVNHQKGKMALAHNGNLSNALELRDKLELSGAIFHTTSDTETIAYVITRERLMTPSIEEAVSNTMNLLEGAYSLVMISSTKMIAARDPYGFRPLCYGKTADGAYVAASESCALSAVGAEFIRDVLPGEILVFTENGVESRREHCEKQRRRTCIFEYIYFARPDSTIDGINVHLFREEAGRCLAKQAPVDADIVASVPDSGNDAALGYSKESKIPYDFVFIKSKYIGRTFIQNTQNKRKKLVNLKLNPLKHTVKDKKIVLVDDSIVRGTTITRIIKSLKAAGAKEVHIRVASPAFVDVCYFGTDVDKRENLIAHNKTVEEIRQEIGADSLEYLSLDSLKEITKDCKVDGFCDGCFTGKYPIEVPKNIDKDKFEKIQF